MWKQKQKQYSKQNKNFAFNTHRFYIALTSYYKDKGHIQIKSNHSTINAETKNNTVNKMTNLPSIHIDFMLYYITLTRYYIAKNTFRKK